MRTSVRPMPIQTGSFVLATETAKTDVIAKGALLSEHLALIFVPLASVNGATGRAIGALIASSTARSHRQPADLEHCLALLPTAEGNLLPQVVIAWALAAVCSPQLRLLPSTQCCSSLRVKALCSGCHRESHRAPCDQVCTGGAFSPLSAMASPLVPAAPGALQIQRRKSQFGSAPGQQWQACRQTRLNKWASSCFVGISLPNIPEPAATI